jgi:hypothetical protein
MNKKSKKRAFFVYVIICLLYVFVTFGIPEKISMKRTSREHMGPSKGAIIPLPDVGDLGKVLPWSDGLGKEQTATGNQVATEQARIEETIEKSGVEAQAEGPSIVSPSDFEPSQLITIPIICYAIQEGLLEKGGLIFLKKDAYNIGGWRKPLEIIKDHDEDGIKSILNTIGQKRLLMFVKGEGISVEPNLSAEDIMLGKGYTIEKKKLLGLYSKYVGNRCDEFLPFSSGGRRIVKNGSQFDLVEGTKTIGDRTGETAEAEWMMPNLETLSMRAAIEKLSVHTSRITVHGNGFVVSQSPRAFERLKGEQECTIQGRTQIE